MRVVGIQKKRFCLLLENQEWEGQAIGRNCLLYYDGSQKYHIVIIGGRQIAALLKQNYSSPLIWWTTPTTILVGVVN
jgi:hypothetical protein